MKTFYSNKRLKRWTIFDFSMIICLNTSAQIAALKGKHKKIVSRFHYLFCVISVPKQLANTALSHQAFFEHFMNVKTLRICRALRHFQYIFIKKYSSVWSQRKQTFLIGENDDVNSNFKIKTINFIPNTAAQRIIVQCYRLSLQSKRSCTCILRCKR